MARAIEPTPTLYGKNADRFVRMIFEPPTEKEKKLAKEMMEEFKNHDPFADD